MQYLHLSHLINVRNDNACNAEMIQTDPLILGK
jgi:hypothetical protein